MFVLEVMRTGKTIPNIPFPQGNSETTQNTTLRIQIHLMLLQKVLEDAKGSSLCLYFKLLNGFI